MFGDQVRAKREQNWDYYDPSQKSYIYLDCRIHNKLYLPSQVEIENEASYLSGLPLPAREYPDLQLWDSDGVWFTNSDNPDNYLFDPEYEEPMQCDRCDIICDLRDDETYLNEDNTCPFPDPEPALDYWKVQDYDQSCRHFLHPLLLQDIDAINRRRRRTAKRKLWGYLKQKKWRDLLISKRERIIDVWRRNYQPATFYFNSFDTIKLYLKTAPPELRRSRMFLKSKQIHML